MNRIRRINTRKLKKIAKLLAISAAAILIGILLQPLFTFTFKIVYVYIILHVLVRVWSDVLRD
jgi:hypothetical protein